MSFINGWFDISTFIPRHERNYYHPFLYGTFFPKTKIECNLVEPFDGYLKDMISPAVTILYSNLVSLRLIFDYFSIALQASINSNCPNTSGFSISNLLLCPSYLSLSSSKHLPSEHNTNSNQLVYHLDKIIPFCPILITDGNQTRPLSSSITFKSFISSVLFLPSFKCMLSIE